MEEMGGCLLNDQSGTAPAILLPQRVGVRLQLMNKTVVNGCGVLDLRQEVIVQKLRIWLVLRSRPVVAVVKKVFVEDLAEEASVERVGFVHSTSPSAQLAGHGPVGRELATP
jgi:hypothetical protein